MPRFELANWVEAAAKIVVYETLRRMLNAFVTDLIGEVSRRVTELGATSLAEIRRALRRLAALSPEMEAARATTKDFLYDSLYNSSGQEHVHEQAEKIVIEVFDFLMAEPEWMPQDHQAQIPAEGLARTVADYIAGMTDSYVVQLWKRGGGR